MVCTQLALSDSNGEADFFVSDGSSDGSSSLLEPKDHLRDHPDTHFKQKIRVRTRTLDDWADEHGINRVDLLWLDMQGYEMHMLKASPRILKTVTAIYAEVSTRDTYEGVVKYPEFRSWLESQGFKVQLVAIPDGWDMGNVLFVRQ